MDEMRACNDLYEIICITNNDDWKQTPDLDKIRNCMNDQMQMRIVKPGNSICTQENIGKYVHYVLLGKYFHYRDSEWGKRNLVALYKGPQWIGMDRTLGIGNANNTKDLVIEECVVIDIKPQYFIQCINEKGGTSLYIIRNLLEKMSSTSSRVDHMLFADSRTQTLQWIQEYWNCYYDGGDECVIDLKNDYIAEAIGINVRTLYRTIKELKEEELLKVRKGNIVINSLQIKRINETISGKK